LEQSGVYLYKFDKQYFIYKFDFFVVKCNFYFYPGAFTICRLFHTHGKAVQTELAKNLSKMYFCHALSGVSFLEKINVFHAF
jgi:hypothetical protein